MNIGEKIKNFRKMRGLTQNYIAEVMGVTCQAVSKWEKGDCMPDITRLPLLAKALGVSVDDLLSNSKLYCDITET